MTKWQLDRDGGPWDYPTLGFSAVDGAIIDGSLSNPVMTDPPDGYWTEYVGGSAETGVTRWGALVHPPAPAEPTEGSVYVYRADDNRGEWANGEDVFAPGTSLGDALSATYALKAELSSGGFLIDVTHGPFNAAGDGVTDDTAAIQAALDAVPADGGIVFFPAGNYLVAGGLTCDAPVQLMGVGTGTYETTSGGSRIQCSSTTANLLTLSSPGTVVSGLTFENTGAIGSQAAGAALLCTDFDWGRIERCMFIGFWNQVQVDVGYFYSIRDTAFLRPVNYGCYMRNTATGQFDHGDQVLEGCNFSKYGDPNDGGTAVRWESGGGLRLIGCKVNAGTQPGYTTTGFWSSGFVTEIGATGAGSTSVHTITGCSVEGFRVDGIKVAIAATGTFFGKVAISGNELLSSGDSTAVAIRLGMDTFIGGGAYLNNVAVTGNVAYGGGTGLKATGVERLTVVGNSFYNMTGPALTLSRVLAIAQRDNLFSTSITDADADLTTSSTGRARGLWEMRRDVAALTTNAFYGKVKLGAYSEGVIRVRVHGNVATVGGVRLDQSRVLSRTTGNVTVGATVGADLALGPAAGELTITLDTTTEAGYAKVKVTSATGKSFTGVVEVEYDGVASVFSYAN